MAPFYMCQALIFCSTDKDSGMVWASVFQKKNTSISETIVKFFFEN